MKERLKRLGADSAIYGIGFIVSKGLVFLLLPVYTRLFSPQQFGSIEMLSSFGGFLATLIVTGMNGSQSFYFFKHKEDGRREQARIITASLQWRIISGAVLCMVVVTFSAQLSRFLLIDSVNEHIVIVAAFSAFLAQLTSHNVEVLRLLYRPKTYILVATFEAVLSAAISLFLITFYGMGIIGYFLGFVCGSLLTLCIAMWQIRDYLNLSTMHSSWWPPLLRFGLPLLVSTIGAYVIYNTDRWFINYFLGSSELGIYAIGAKFGMIAFVVINIFRQAVWPIAMEAMHTPDGPQFFRILSIIYMGVAAILAVIITALSPLFISLFAAVPYRHAYPLVGILCWCPIMYGFMMITGSGIWKAERTILSPFIVSVAALVNVSLSFYMVPAYGLNGAAIATVFSYVVWSVLTLYASERLWPVGYPFLRLFLLVSCGMTVTALIIWMFVNNRQMWQIITVSIAAILSIVVISLYPIKTWDELKRRLSAHHGSEGVT